MLLLLAATIPTAGDRSGAIRFGSDEHEHEFAQRKTGPDAFDSIGQIDCPKPLAGANHSSTTGWLIGDNQTIITAAHAFYPTARRKLSIRIIDPASCSFVLFNRDRSVRGKYTIRYALSPWADARRRYDMSYDIAIARLGRPVVGAIVPRLRPTQKFAGTTTRLYAFRSTGQERGLLHESEGMVERFANNRDRLAVAAHFGLRISRPEALLLSSASSMWGSSGGMYYSSEWGAAIGVHLGHVCLSYQTVSSFDPRSCFNYGRFISPTVLGLARGVAVGRPRLSYLVETKTHRSPAEPAARSIASR